MDTEDKLTRDIAVRVRAARTGQEPPLTQEELGAKLGLSKVGYGHYERGTQPFSVWHLFRLSHILGRPVEYFLDLCSDLRGDEQMLLGAYRRLDGSPHQARVLVSALEMCRIWAESPPVPQESATLHPLVVAQQLPDGRLQLVQQGEMAVTSVGDAGDYAPVDDRPLSERERLLVKYLRQMTSQELDQFEQELQAKVAGASASGLAS